MLSSLASAPSMSVSVECVNICNFWKGDTSGSRSRYDCSVLSCAWKAPRALTGFLASTAHPHCSASSPYRRTRRRNRIKCRCEASDMGGWHSSEFSEFVIPGRLLRSNHVTCRKWRLCCSSASYDENRHMSSCMGYNFILSYDLKHTISYLPPKELELVCNALNLAFEAHDGQKRRSGEPFIIHPVEVAQILGELELDWESIAAGLLHDTVEDTDVTFERIEKEFGPAVRHIVEGETKVSKLGKLKCKNENHSVEDVKADDLRQMFLAMTEEVRVIIVKLADRLHNMRTLSHMPPHKQVSSIAMETLQVFAPLAKLLGMYQIKSELENLSFMYTNAQDYAEVKRRVADLYKEHEKELIQAHKILMKKIEDDQFLDLMTVKTEVQSGCKDPYSIYKAVLKSEGSINEVNQIAQLRIIIKPKPCIGVRPLCNAQQVCYHVLGLVHGIWTPIPRFMKDYIATPKPNGYQSLHTTVIPFLYESMFRLEVQIRTEEMDLIADRGIATHYCGKGFVTGLVGHAMLNDRSSRGKPVSLNNANIALRIGWLNAINEWQEEFVGNMSSREFVDTITRDLLGSRVFIFTPKGEIKNLPKGATVIDYAYMIHTEIGNKMVAAKVNGNLVSPSHILANAEVVEVITYKKMASSSRGLLTLFPDLNESTRERTGAVALEPQPSAPEFTPLNFPMRSVEQRMAVQSDVEANQYTLKSCVETMTAVTNLSNRLQSRANEVHGGGLDLLCPEVSRCPDVVGLSQPEGHRDVPIWRAAICCSGGVWGSERARRRGKHRGSTVKSRPGRGQEEKTGDGVEKKKSHWGSISPPSIYCVLLSNLQLYDCLLVYPLFYLVDFQGLSNKSAFQRHKQWLQHAKTRSAKHKIMKCLREQAALLGTELTTETVNEDDSEIEECSDYSKGNKHTWEKILKNVMEMSSSKINGNDIFQLQHGSIQVPKVNGKHNKNMQDMGLKTKGEMLSQGNGVAKMILTNIPTFNEVLPGLQSWHAGKVASWHNLEGHSIQWFCVVCMDQRGMMADITTVLADVGVTICACAAEMDRGRGIAVMLFHVEGSLDSLVSACSRLDLIFGVLGWSTGCSWPSLIENQQFLEC
ncbi:hypothetical protein TEA_015639 [Camellia sinensis var. sinensis]|uniref:Putative GTP diphosphokinase RSH1, chloroplastic n=1 Tax=Camellia sinensis var. sinensis TaxID=542762 RepID=A0A4S4EEB1_CAMSN|nr:hypothetical protein TEA_015639 [Camellia sinensis var. sinensis]